MLSVQAWQCLISPLIQKARLVIPGMHTHSMVHEVRNVFLRVGVFWESHPWIKLLPNARHTQGISWLVTLDASCTAPWWELQQSLSFVVSPLQLIGRRDWTLELQDNVCQDLGQGMSCFIINTGNYLASGFFSWMVDLPGDLHRARFTILNLWLLFCFQYRCF